MQPSHVDLCSAVSSFVSFIGMEPYHKVNNRKCSGLLVRSNLELG